MKTQLAVWKFDSLVEAPSLQAITLSGERRSLDQVSAALPAGAYTTLRTYQGNQALRLQDHLARLAQTADLAGAGLPIMPSGLRSAIRQGLALYHAGDPAAEDVRLRLTIDLERQPGQAYLAIEPLHTPDPADYANGVRAVTVQLERQLPEAKLTRFIERSQPVRRTLPPDVNEALMVDHAGLITEGLSSNFFAVLGGQLRTAGQGVLAGVTRSIVLDCARQLDCGLVMQAVPVSQLGDIQEAFITSSSRGLLPLSQIDRLRIGEGLPGRLTRRLMSGFERAVAAQLQPI